MSRLLNHGWLEAPRLSHESRFAPTPHPAEPVVSVHQHAGALVSPCGSGVTTYNCGPGCEVLEREREAT